MHVVVTVLPAHQPAPVDRPASTWRPWTIVATPRRTRGTVETPAVPTAAVTHTARSVNTLRHTVPLPAVVYMDRSAVRRAVVTPAARSMTALFFSILATVPVLAVTVTSTSTRRRRRGVRAAVHAVRTTAVTTAATVESPSETMAVTVASPDTHVTQRLAVDQSEPHETTRAQAEGTEQRLDLARAYVNATREQGRVDRAPRLLAAFALVLLLVSILFFISAPRLLLLVQSVLDSCLFLPLTALVMAVDLLVVDFHVF